MFYNRMTREYPVQVRRPMRPFFNQYGFGGQFGYNQYPQFNNVNTFNTLNNVEQPYTTTNPWGWTPSHIATPVTDVLELDDQYILEIALPGVVLDDVELKVEENLITVVAKRTPNMFEERATMLRKEMPCGYFVRHFEFETLIVHEHIEARMDRGILFVSIPKVEAALRIPVSAGSIESHMPNVKSRITTTNDVLRGEKVTVK